jgi:general secretion pathway protein H
MNHRQRGFTLLEILVVISMLAILAVGVGLSLGTRGSALAELEAERLRGLLEVARDESLHGGRAVQWQASGSGYRFLQSALEGDTGFAERPLDERLRPRELPAELRLAALSIGGRRMPADAGLIFIAGQTPRFTLELRQGERESRIEGHASGDIALHTAAATQ